MDARILVIDRAMELIKSNQNGLSKLALARDERGRETSPYSTEATRFCILGATLRAWSDLWYPGGDHTVPMTHNAYGDAARTMGLTVRAFAPMVDVSAYGNRAETSTWDILAIMSVAKRLVRKERLDRHHMKTCRAIALSQRRPHGLMR